MSVDHCHDLGALAALGFAHASAPFFLPGQTCRRQSIRANPAYHEDADVRPAPRPCGAARLAPASVGNADARWRASHSVEAGIARTQSR
jgi:hypothetical protein